ncbi:hypothetical protein GN956_G9590 [Arapaima gigas]
MNACRSSPDPDSVTQNPAGPREGGEAGASGPSKGYGAWRREKVSCEGAGEGGQAGFHLPLWQPPPHSKRANRGANNQETRRRSNPPEGPTGARSALFCQVSAEASPPKPGTAGEDDLDDPRNPGIPPSVPRGRLGSSGGRQGGVAVWRDPTPGSLEKPTRRQSFLVRFKEDDGVRPGG